MSDRLRSQSIGDTFQIAREFSARLKAGERVGLIGELGAGKTVFAKGVISGLCGVPVEDIPSPTFTLIEEYPGPIYHVDLYRMNSSEEAKELAWDDLFSPQAIALIEWPEKVPGLAEGCRYTIRFLPDGPESRILDIQEKSLPGGKDQLRK